MYLVTNTGKNSLVIMVNKKEVYFKPFLPVEIDTISKSEMELLKNIPMLIEEFSIDSPVVESPVVGGESLSAGVSENISMIDSVPMSDSSSITAVESAPVKPEKEKSAKIPNDLRSFGRKRKSDL